MFHPSLSFWTAYSVFCVIHRLDFSSVFTKAQKTSWNPQFNLLKFERIIHVDLTFRHAPSFSLLLLVSLLRELPCGKWRDLTWSAIEILRTQSHFLPQSFLFFFFSFRDTLYRSFWVHPISWLLSTSTKDQVLRSFREERTSREAENIIGRVVTGF